MVAFTPECVGEKRREKKISCFRGHAYGGLAVIHSRGWMAQGSVLQLLIMTDLYPATASSLPLSFFFFYILSTFICSVLLSLCLSPVGVVCWLSLSPLSASQFTPIYILCSPEDTS